MLITGFRHEMDPQVERLIAEGADAIHFKPLDVPELFSTVWQLA